MKAKLLPWIASASLLGLGMSAAGAPTPQPNEVDLSAALAGTSEIKRDWGDAPNSYGTLQSSSGARHVINPNILLGQLIDAEGDGQPSGTALLDDTTPPGAPNDEDGVAIVSPLIVGQPATLAVTVKLTGLNSAFLNGWIDYSRNGNWGQSGERVLTNRTVVNGVNTITFTVPQSAATGLTAARFRLSSTMLNAPTGEASDGEVEDYGIEIRAAPQGATLDYGDAPNTAPYSFPTLLSENGARHTTLALATNQPFVMLGTKVDLEADGQPSLGAGGDDANDTHAPAPANEDDEDGVTFTTPLNPGQQATVRVVVTSFAIEFRWL
ncbi:MAG: GEVED domain-containing protein, partial [Verrucomicrobiota bacterium]